MSLSFGCSWSSSLGVSAIYPAPKASIRGAMMNPDVRYFTGKHVIIRNNELLSSFVLLLRCIDISSISVECIFKRGPVIFSDGERSRYDIRKIEPVSLEICVIQHGSKAETISVSISLGSDISRDLLQDVLSIPAVYVGKGLKEGLHVFWSLGITEPSRLWDLEVYQRGRTLGLVNIGQRERLGCGSEESSRQRLLAERADALCLGRMCTGLGVHMSDPRVITSSGYDAELMRSRLEVYSCLYRAQVLDALDNDTLDHFSRIEMPWVVTNARMEWNGIRVDRMKAAEILAGSSVHWPVWEGALQKFSIVDVSSPQELVRHFRSLKLLSYFEKGGGYAFSQSALKEYKALHPSVDIIRKARQIKSLETEQILHVNLVCQDGRVHPVHLQLHAETGRQGANLPNVLGFSKVLRNLVVPEDGYGIGEVDLSQIEVGIAAGFYNDHYLIRAFNSGDVYSDMAKGYFKNELQPSDLQLSSEDFKKAHGQKRASLKTCVLAILYGGTEHTIRTRLGCSQKSAVDMKQGFLEMLPQIRDRLSNGVLYDVRRGYVRLVSGLKVFLDPVLSEDARRRLAMNAPIQGSAAAVFKAAGNRLDKVYQKYGARLLIPLHDSYVFEAPLDCLSEVAELTRIIMCETVSEFFPSILARAEVNIAHPQSWNKDGLFNAANLWIEEGKY